MGLGVVAAGVEGYGEWGLKPPALTPTPVPTPSLVPFPALGLALALTLRFSTSHSPSHPEANPTLPAPSRSRVLRAEEPQQLRDERAPLVACADIRGCAVIRH